MKNINNFHSMLKKFMIRFNGVATKYIDFYMDYFKNVRDKVDVFNQLLLVPSYYRVCDIRNKRVCFERMVNGVN